jgi:hypothetical protein
VDWEKWLRDSSSPPSDSEDERRDRTEGQVKDALRAYGPLEGRSYAVYTKGSYANNTNVRLNYDVDIAVEYRGFFYCDLMFDLKDSKKADIGLVDSTDPYTRAEFKFDIKAALTEAFGSSAVSQGDIAYRVREKKTTLPADVVPCWEYRRYDRVVNGAPVFQEGSRVYRGSGGHTDNYPAQQKTNGTGKNVRTGMRYKYMVRALKRLQTKLVVDGDLTAELPSYLIECLVYNVPDSSFGNSEYLADMRNVLARIFNATLASGDSEEWEEVNGLKYLFRGSNSWSVSQVHELADAAWDKLGLE